MPDPVGEAYVRLRPSSEGFAAATKKLLASVKLPPQTGIKTSLDGVAASFKDVTAAARQAATVQVSDAIRVQNELRAEANAYRLVASAATAGSREQLAATNLAIDAENRLQRQLGQTADAERRAGAAAASRRGVGAGGAAGAAASGATFGAIARGAAGATVGFAGIAGAITAATLAFKGIVVEGAKFEQQLNVFQAVTDATADDMARVGAEAKQLGRDITLPGVSAADAAASMLELAKGGLTVDQSLAAARGTLELAKAASIDFGEAAKVTARNLSAFELSGDQATKVADLLAGASIAATGEVSDMAIALQQSAAVAHNAGISVSDTTTAIAELAKAGLVGSDAGTSLRTMLLRLLPSTNKAAEKMTELGVKVLDFKGNILPLPRILDSYRKALLPLSVAQRQQALNTIFGQDAIRSAAILTRGGSKAFEELAKTVTKAGQAQILASAQTKGLSGSFGALRSNLETIGISIAQRINPGIKAFVDSINAGLDWVTANWPRFEQAITPAIDRVVAVVRQNWPQVHAIIVETLDRVTVAVQSAVVIVTTLWDRFGARIQAITKIVFDGVLDTVRHVARTVGGILDVFAKVLTGKWGEAWGSLKEVALEQLRFTYEQIKRSLGIFKNIGVAIVDLMRDGFVGAFHALEETALRAVESLLNILNKIPTRFSIRGHGVGIKNPAGAALDAVRGKLSDIRTDRESKSIADAFARNTAAAMEAKTRDITQAFEAPVSEAVDKSVVRVAVRVAPAAKTAGKKIGDTVAEGIHEGITTGAQNSIDALKKRLAEAVVETSRAVQAAVIQAQQNLSGLGSTLAQQLSQIIDAGPLGQLVKKLTDQLAGREANRQSAQLRKAITDAQKDLTLSRGSIAAPGSLNAAERVEVGKFLAPKRQALADAKRAWADFQVQAVIGGAQAAQERQKTAIQRQIDGLVTRFNQGVVSQAGFASGLAGIIESQKDAIGGAAKNLGTSFVATFDAQVAGLILQSKAIQKARNKGLPALLGEGSRPTITEPTTVLNQQLKVQRDILSELKRTRTQAAAAAAKKNEKADAAAKKKAAKKGGSIDLSALMLGPGA